MFSIIPFDFESHDVRIITDDNGDLLFVAKDVAVALEYKDTVNAIKQHCKGVVKHHPLQTVGGIQNARVIHEPDLYRMVIGSNLPSAQRFESWLFEKVLPSIRKTGGYYTGKDSFREHAAALRSLAETASAFANAASALAAKYEPYVASPSHNTTTTVQKIIPVLSPIPPRELAFIHAWWECFGNKTVTASDLYRAIATKQCQVLNDNSSALLGDIELWTAKKLSHALRRWSQLALDGYRVQNIGKSSHGITWRLELLAA